MADGDPELEVALLKAPTDGTGPPQRCLNADWMGSRQGLIRPISALAHSFFHGSGIIRAIFHAIIK
jgi:hypothetical protein